MKKNLLLLSGLILLNIVQVKAQWIPTAGPYGGPISALVVDSPFVYAGGDYSGVHISTDNGFNWSKINNGLTCNRVMSLIKVSGNLFAGTDVGGIFLSTNNGASWTQSTNGLPPASSLVVFCFATNGTTIYAGTTQGIFMTTNFGSSWTLVNNGITNFETRSILIDGNKIFAAPGNEVYYSNNGGLSWTDISNGLNNQQIGQLAMIDTILFASALNDDTLYISHDNGNSWSSTNFSVNQGWTDCLFADSGKLYASTNWDWLYVSQDTGKTWQQIKNGLPQGIGSISKIGSNLIVATNGIYQSSDGGLNWMKTDTGLAATEVYDLFLDGSNLFAASWGGGVSYSSDGGAIWSVPDTNVNQTLMCGVTAKNNNVFGVGYSGIWHSSDYGANWSSVTNSLGAYNFNAAVNNKSGVLCAAMGGLFYSTNNGNSWTPITSGITDFGIESLVSDGDTAFFSTYSENIFRSTDGGMNWTQVYNGTIVNNPIWQIDMDGNNIAAATNHGVLVSSDLGNTWSFANNGLNNLACLSIAVKDVNLWVSTFSGVYFSNNLGVTWSYFHTGLDTLQRLLSFEIDSNFIYGGGRYSGVWKRSLSDFPLGISEIKNQNQALVFPNPFSTEATIKINFNLKNADLKIYDCYGQVVREQKNISGCSFALSRKNLSNGIYFVNIVQDSKIILTNKLIITD